MKKVLLSIILVLSFTVGFCLTASASDTGYGSFTYVNPIYQDSAVTFAPYSMRAAVQETAEPIYHTTYADAAEELLAAMLDRKSSITIGYQTTNPQDSHVLNIYYEAFKHNGISDAGDYLRYNHGGTSYSFSSYRSGTVTYYTVTYTPMYYTTSVQEAELDAEIDRILSQLNLEGKDEYERSTAIYDYICQNVTYDYENLNDDTYTRKYTAYAALVDGTAVCQGYAALYYRMALEAGLDTRVIAGIGNGGPHAWNIVRIGDLYYNLDATWDADPASYDYYLKCDANFPSHSRDAEMLTPEFMTAYPMSSEDYVYPYLKGVCGENLTWRLDHDGTLTISGTGAMDDYGYMDGNRFTYWQTPWASCGDVKKLVIEDGVTSIGFAAFIDQIQLTEVSIGSSLQTIGDTAFFGCTSLSQIRFAGTPPTIGTYAFKNNNWATIDVTFICIEGTDGWTTPTWTSNGTSYNTVMQKRTPEIVVLAPNGIIEYTADTQTLTVSDSNPTCIVMYKDANGQYKTIEAAQNSNGNYNYGISDAESITIAVKGDYSGDGDVSVSDAKDLQKAILGKEDHRGTPDPVCDINGDGRITAIDLALIAAAALDKYQFAW